MTGNHSSFRRWTFLAALLFCFVTCVSLPGTVLAQDSDNETNDPTPGKKKATGFTKMMDDPYDPVRKREAEEAMINVYREHEKMTDVDFERTQDEVHRHKRSASKTFGYQNMRERRNQIRQWLERYEDAYPDKLKAAERAEAFRKAIDGIKESDRAARAEKEAKAVERALNGELGPITPEGLRMLRNLEHALAWIIRLTKAEARLTLGIEALEATSSPYARKSTSGQNGLWRIKSKQAQGGSTVRCAEKDDAIRCVVEQPSARAEQEPGMRAGDLSLEGQLSQDELSGVKFDAVNMEAQSKCSSLKGAQPNEIRNSKVSSDGSRITGERRFPLVYLSNCRVVDNVEIWQPFEYVRAD